MRLRSDVEDQARPRLHALRERALDRRAINAHVAGALLAPVKANFAVLGVTNLNRMGAPSSGFWQKMVAGVVPRFDTEAAYVRTPRQVALRYFGGTVVPKNGAKNLAIPATIAAYNQSPKAFSDLRFAIIGGHKALVQAAQQQVRYRTFKKSGRTVAYPGQVKGGTVYYWLVPDATIQPNRAVLPPLAVMQATARTACNEYFNAHRN